MSNVQEALVEYILQAAPEPAPPPAPLQPEYEDLGRRVYEFAMKSFNRLIAFVRAEKAQYWLDDYVVDSGMMQSAFNSFGATVTVDNCEPIRWRPSNSHKINVHLIDESRSVNRDDWVHAQKFVSSSRRPPLVFELLARAEAFAGSCYRRAALIEAATALEVAVSQFVENPKANEAFGSILAARMGIPSLKNQREALGLRGTVRFLFAVIFSEEKMPANVLVTCQEAINARNNLVHNGQRDVPEEQLATFLPAVRRLCDILASYSAESD